MLNIIKKGKLIALGAAILSSLLCACDGTNSAAYRRQVEETKEVIHNLTCSEKEYEYYFNKSPTPNSNSYKLTTRSDEFLSWKTKTFKNINGKSVKTFMYYYPSKSSNDNCNFGYGLLLYKAIKYKLAHPEEENEIYTCEFRLSSLASVNVVKTSKWYGCMKNLTEAEMDKYGFVRISYMLYFAAKIGIHVRVIPQLHGYSNYGTEIKPTDYFKPKLDENCSAKHGLKDHKVKEFLKFRKCKWKSYNNKAAADMLHAKFIAVKHYLDDDNKVVSHAFYTSSSNLDGINENGSNGNSNAQTGILVTNHEYLYNVYKNFNKFVYNYLGPEDADSFRTNYFAKIKEQRTEIETNGYENIKDSMMVYLGTEKDKVFELYFTPFDLSECGNWSANIPQCKYVEKLKNSYRGISVYMTNPKNSNFALLNTFYEKTAAAFKVVRNEIEVENSELFIRTIDPLPTSFFKSVKIGQHLSKKTIMNDPHHQKDILLEYYDAEDEQMHGTTLWSTVNNHLGAYFYQVNTILVVNESEKTGMGNIHKMQQIYNEYEFVE